MHALMVVHACSAPHTILAVKRNGPPPPVHSSHAFALFRWGTVLWVLERRQMVGPVKAYVLSCCLDGDNEHDALVEECYGMRECPWCFNMICAPRPPIFTPRHAPQNDQRNVAITLGHLFGETPLPTGSPPHHTCCLPLGRQ